MKHIKLFEEYQLLLDGAIPVYPPGNPWKNRGSIAWTDVVNMMTNPSKWKTEYDNPTNYTLVVGRADFDVSKYIADPNYRSIPLGTWKNKELPTWAEKHPNYDESQFDFVEIVDNKEKPREPWIKVVDKKGVEFMVAPFEILDIQIGSSIVDDVISGEKFFIDGMRAGIYDYKGGKVKVKTADGEKREYTLAYWKSKNYPTLDEKIKTDDNLTEAL